MPLVRGGNDDILEQWRRRRKVEEMRTRAASGEPVSLAAAQVVRAVFALFVVTVVCSLSAIVHFHVLNMRVRFSFDVLLAFYACSAQVA